MANHVKTLHVTDVTEPFPTHFKVIRTFLIKITPGPAFSRFYHTLSRCRHLVVAKSQVHKAPYETLSIESLIPELVGSPALHNSRDASTKPLRHLVSTGALEIPRSHVIVEGA